MTLGSTGTSLTRSEWDEKWRVLFNAAWLKGETRSRAFDLAHKAMLRFYGPRPKEVTPEPQGHTRPSRWRMVMDGLKLLLQRKEVMAEIQGYDYKKTLAKAARYAGVVAIGAIAGIAGSLSVDKEFLGIFEAMPFGVYVAMGVVAGLKALQNFISNRDK